MPVGIKELNPKKKMPLPKPKPRHANPKHPMNTEKTKPLGKAGGGKLKMVEKGGKKVPFFAADGKGKMAMGGMMKKKGMAAGGRMKKKGMAKGGMMKKGYAKGGPVKVKSGDTLSQIAKKNGLTLKSLMAANPGIKNANEIRVGQSIKMPTGRAEMRSGIAFQDVDKNLNKRNNVYAGMTKSSMKALADDTAAKKAKKAGKPVSKKQSETANKRARVTTRLNQLGAINKERRAADADKRPSAAKKTKSQVEVSKGTRAMSKASSLKNVSGAENKRLAELRAKARKRVDRKAGGGMMKKKGRAKGGMMKKGMAKGGMMKKGRAAGGVMRGTGAAIKGKRFGRSG